jgi:hydrogenase-4 component E
VQDLVSILSVLLILLNFRLLGTSRLAAGIQTAALQAVVLGVLPILANPSISAQLIVVLVIATILKAGVLPWLIRRSAREASVQSEVDPILGFTTSLLVGVGLFAACISIANRLHMPAEVKSGFLVPVALFTVFCGLFLIIFRRKAVTQVLGYLVMENGIFLFGMAFAVHEAFLVEMGVLLDVFAAVFVMGIAIYHISREFDHVDTDRMSTTGEQ